MNYNYDFQAWLETPVSNDPEAILAGKEEYLRLYLTDAMRTIREKEGLTQTQLAEKLKVDLSVVEKIESPLHIGNFDIIYILGYLQILNADIEIALKHEGDLYKVTENKDNGK